jgi:hypothetical protein
MAGRSRGGCSSCLGNGCFWLLVVGLMAYAWGNSGLGLHIVEALSLVAVIGAGMGLEWHRRRAAASPTSGGSACGRADQRR